MESGRSGGGQGAEGSRELKEWRAGTDGAESGVERHLLSAPALLSQLRLSMVPRQSAPGVQMHLSSLATPAWKADAPQTEYSIQVVSSASPASPVVGAGCRLTQYPNSVLHSRTEATVRRAAGQMIIVCSGPMEV
eukprot:gene3764-biopygen7147